VDYKVYMQTNSAIGYEVLLNSTKSLSFILVTSFSLPLNQQFYFIVQPFNMIGPGYNSSALTVILKIPDTPY
jgi:hypothetical protein